MEAIELARWTRFAAKGGIGKCTALYDCVAEDSSDLMFLKGDEITVLMQLPNLANKFLGYCEGVVGRFNGSDVTFHSKLKKPVMAKRSSASPASPAASPRPRVSIDEHIAASLVLPRSNSASGVGLGVGVVMRNDGDHPIATKTSPQWASLSSRHTSLLSSYSQESKYDDPDPSVLRFSNGLPNISIDSPDSVPLIAQNTESSKITEAVEQPVITQSTSDSSTSSLYISSSSSSSNALYSSTVATPITIKSSSPAVPTTPTIHTASTVPDTSASAISHFSINDREGEQDGGDNTGIGLSLLQNLVDGDGWGDDDDDDSDEDGQLYSGDPSNVPINGAGSTTGRQHIRESMQSFASEGSRYSRYSSDGSTLGLGYEDTETGHSVSHHSHHSAEAEAQLEADLSQTQAVFAISTQHIPTLAPIDAEDEDREESPVLGRNPYHSQAQPQSLGQQMMTFPPVAPLSPSRGRFVPSPASQESQESAGSVESRGTMREEEQTYEFPTPPTHTPSLSFSGGGGGVMGGGSQSSRSPPSSYRASSYSQAASASTASSPASPSFPPPSFDPSSFPSSSDYSDPTRTRRPSTTSTATTSDNADGFGDIYDDYRYSRFSVATMGTVTSGSGNGSIGAGRRSMSSRVSAASVFTLGGGDNYPVPQPQSQSQPAPPQPQPAQPQQQQRTVRTRSRSNTTASLNPVVLSPVPSTPPPTQPLPDPPIHAYAHGHVASSSGSSLGSPRLGMQNGYGSGRSQSGSDSGSEGYQNRDREGSISSQGPGAAGRPAPLKLASSNHDSAPTHLGLSPPQNLIQLQNHSLNHQSIRSPLLHTAWASPVTSPASSTAQFAFARPTSNHTLSQQAQTPSTAGSGSDGSSTNGSGGRATVSMAFPRGLDALGMVVESHLGTEARQDREAGTDQRDSGAQEEDGDEDEDRVVLAPGEEGVDVEDRHEGYDNELESEDHDTREEDTTLVVGGLLHESPLQTPSSSPEPEPDVVVKSRLAPLVVANKTPSPGPRLMVEDDDEDEDEEDRAEMEREKELLRMQAAEMIRKEGDTTMQSPSPQLQSQAAASPPPPAPSTISSPPPSMVVSPPPSATSSPIPVVAQNVTTTASHLRPKLSDIRLPADRQSLFLPHPNAPKATPASLSPGPIIASQSHTNLPPPRSPNQPPAGSVFQVLRMALAGHGPPVHPRGRGPTIYGVLKEDFANSIGPVPIQFGLDPPKATAPPGGSPLVPAPRMPSPAMQSPPPPSPLGMGSRVAGTPPLTLQTTAGSTPPLQPSTSLGVQPRMAVRRVGSAASLDVASARSSASGIELTGQASATESGGGSGAGAGGVIPRANFFPTVGGARPRSRSFSGFQNTTTEVPLPVQRSRDLDEQQMPTATEVKRSLSPIIASPVSPTTGTINIPPKPSPLRVSSSPSRQELSTSPAARPFRPPNSPLTQSFVAASASVPSSPTTTSPPRLLRQTASRSTLSETPVTRVAPVSRPALNSTPSSPQPDVKNRPSVDADSASIHSSRSNVASPPPPANITRQNSLRTKLSLPNLNLRRNHNKHEENSVLTPISPTTEADMLQVQDMDFELVRPNFSHFQGVPRSSEDSGVMGRDMSVDARQDGSFLRTGSPSLSPNPPRSPTVVSDGGSSVWQPIKASARGAGTDSETSSASNMDAHRQRETKWMAVLGSVQPSQSRKSKKVKKLVFDGVPSSVRYLVWSMLTDGKARCVPGVYTQLGGRGRVAASSDVERDVQRCFADHPQLQRTEGPVLSLLQAYLTMVPDVRYVTGLTLVAGNLLLLAPEEDAFWIFVSIMDTHIRPYFSSTSVQIDVDASLFGRAMDTADPTLAKKLFADLNIPPSSICRPWFTSLFVGSLPADYLNRVWDIFLFEAIQIVLRPAPELLPTSPEALITLALAVKLKDEDLKKQRVKLEAQAKRQTMPRTAPVATPGAISLPRA
ncbi:hypothetical protein H0H92_015651 [Tricholoma furcatifolium]|nr:hypothetical protein H0H92_015651 [Tricholoma furcatifolium]